ncbi:MAG TPA: VOC family protein [Kofleriaceae bacterium]|jgi:uncharacterized glyoxalase superfamily protein PhnB
MSIASKPLPKGWPRISSSVFYMNAGSAIDWLCKAFGFEIRIKIEGDGGTIAHSELELGGGLVMVGDSQRADRPHQKSPKELGGANTQVMFTYVDDVDAHCERARKAGATIHKEPTTTDYGEDYWSDRSYEAIDPEGHHWYFAQRLRG